MEREGKMHKGKVREAVKKTARGLFRFYIFGKPEAPAE